MQSVIFQTFGSIYTIYECSMVLLPVIFALENIGVYVGTTNSDNVTANVEASINKYFCIWAILGILDINPDDYYV